jgi:hypothetical protein
MAVITTYDLIQCSGLYPTVEGANNSYFSPFVDAFVRLDGDDEESYKVKKNVQARFFAPKSAETGKDVQYSVTSILFNGMEALSAPANLTVAEADNIHIDFPLYAAAPTGYTDNLANAVYSEQVGATLGYFERNFADFIQALFDEVGIDADITNSHPDWWTATASHSMNGFMIEITVIPVAADEEPQYDEVYSINSFLMKPLAAEEIDCCPFIAPFRASLRNGSCSTVVTDGDCSKIKFSDTSNYINGLVGHDSDLFNHRTITLTKPDGSEYVWSTEESLSQPIVSGCVTTESVTTVDEVISPQWDSNNIFSYNFTDNDVDGIYSVKICTFPDWSTGLFYDSKLNNMVYRNGVIYKQVASSTSVDPALDTDFEYWTPLEETDSRGRYCDTERVVVLCISILNCYKKAVDEAVCVIGANPCVGMCDNKDLLKAMKMRVTMDALEYAKCAKKWTIAQKHIDILKGICCCNG